MGVNTILPFQELRRATLPIFYDMMKVEFSENHDFKKVRVLYCTIKKILLHKKHHVLTVFNVTMKSIFHLTSHILTGQNHLRVTLFQLIFFCQHPLSVAVEKKQRADSFSNFMGIRYQYKLVTL